MEQTTIIQTLIILFAFSLAGNIIVVDHVFGMQKEVKMRELLYNTTILAEDNILKYGATGVYYDGVMCVVLEGRKYSQVMETCNHEWLHYKDTIMFDRCHFVSSEGCH